MKVEVTQEDIDNGVACDPNMCPIARAIQRIEPQFCVVMVSPDEGCVRVENLVGDSDYFSLPPEACNWADAFDGGKPRNPFVFEMEVAP